MSEEIINREPEQPDSTGSSIITRPQTGVPGRIKFVGVMNILNALLLIVIGIVAAGQTDGGSLIALFIGIIQGTFGYLLFRMNKIAWIINTVFYTFTVVVNLFIVAEALNAGQYFGSVAYYFILMIYFLIIDFCLISAWKSFIKR